ncbi:fimbrillin family protein [uncultured Prevotella sp.]|uniref:fimbrillin family protein n=1 Tax=uncultured Prevotella sp. TaxID=159272 RepID=UPI0027E33AEC|nr:fimbrillin family protein [uncultured Prevotella sp.]
MKKILYSVFMLATMVLAACSSDDTTELDVKRGMVLKANVEDTDTRATITETDTEGKWQFAFATGDVVKVGNDKVEDYYTFTNNGTEFSSADALQTTTPATWCAFFPGEKIDLANQEGTLADVANKYALAGATATPTTGSDGLTVTMKAKAAVLCIVGVNKGESLDINVRTANGKYVSGLTAAKNSADFSVQESDTKVSLLSKQGAGVYYVVVPAGVKLSVYNGVKSLYSDNKIITATKADGLEAGKYYTLTTGMTKGSADNSLGETIDWVQLWAGGPKFATKNVAEEMTWYDATKKRDEYVWGKNWRTPKLDEVYGEGKLNCKDDEETGFKTSVAGSPSFELKEQGGYQTVVFTGVQPGYTKNTLTLYDQIKSGTHNFDFWTASDNKPSAGQEWGVRFAVTVYESNNEFAIVYFGPYSNSDYKDRKYLVRPVLAE